MAIYIKGMKIPKNCGECKFHRPLYHTQFCMILDKNCSPWKEQKRWCPLVEVPELSAEAEEAVLEEGMIVLPQNHVKVVRCKDCRHRVHDEERNFYYCEMYYGQGDVSDENFCQWGERKEE